MKDIFVNITSFCDLELKNTLSDLFAKAAQPDRIRVIVINKGEPIDFPQSEIYQTDLDVPACKCHILGREKIKDEKFYFQCDPHSRFIHHWDNFIRSKAVEGIVFNPPTMKYRLDGSFNNTPLCFQVGDFDEKDIAHTYAISCKEDREKAFICSNSVFSCMDWIKRVPADDRLFNWGWEIDMSIRSIMAGFKIMNSAPILWHLWQNNGTRGGRVPAGQHEADIKSYQVLRDKLTGKTDEWDLKLYKEKMRKLKI